MESVKCASGSVAEWNEWNMKSVKCASGSVAEWNVEKIEMVF